MSPNSFARTLSEHRFSGTSASSATLLDGKEILLGALEGMIDMLANRVGIAFVANYL